ncbi:S-adenosyl-L-methionine-dependent methyltransferase [Irpex rosettiformis]|uniref:S-adenosyl-L-methionine-dependent methyltransferase n=1 Tax=Irpex rosettiformis TaxID=378272 RepID=A0ACB8U615_9APHY|nr:S-adenosyl-L-methionine-dependent methyltransferase [Irpex rosettiformis]
MDCSENRTRPIRALEFYSGIGGLHLALCCSEVEGIVIRAFDWDQAARQVYTSNHGQGIVQQELVPLQANAWLLSPSCQPYTVLNPLAKGSEDPRAKSFIHLIEKVLPDLVETSSTRQRVLHLLDSLDYTTAEFLLTPLQFGIPNSRLRYYLLAKKKPLSFLGHEEGSVLRHIPGSGVDWVDPRTEDDDNPEASIDNIQCYTDPNTSFEEYKISDRVLEKWGRLFDIVLPSSRRTCCFTRGYTKLAERAGSVLQMNEKQDTTTTFVKFLSAQRNGDRDAVTIFLPRRVASPLQLR